jgi:hypothetical protein
MTLLGDTKSFLMSLGISFWLTAAAAGETEKHSGFSPSLSLLVGNDMKKMNRQMERLIKGVSENYKPQL